MGQAAKGTLGAAFGVVDCVSSRYGFKNQQESGWIKMPTFFRNKNHHVSVSYLNTNQPNQAKTNFKLQSKAVVIEYK